jgi:rod shape-determining protein MreD
MNRLVRSRFAVLVCLFFAVILTILPLPAWANWFRPLWVMMVLCYWGLALENYRGIGLAFCAGILLDVLGGTLLGEHALVLVMCIYLVMRFKRQILMYSLGQQAMLMCLLTLLYQGVIYLTEGVMGHLPRTLLFWAPLLTTPLFWPWVFIILRDCRRWFNVT